MMEDHMLEISRRAQQIIASPIRKFLPLVAEAERRGNQVMKLNVGDPDLPAPTAFWRTLKRFAGKRIPYAPSPGIPEHTNAWVKYYATLGIRLRPEDVIPTVGGAEAILFAILAVANPGDEILVFEPLYTSYQGFAAMCGVKLVGVTLLLEHNFSLPPAAEIVKKISSKTKAIVVINPNNPTGRVLKPKALQTICQIAQRHQLFIIADETYREIVFRGRPGTFLAFPRVRHNVIVVDSVSKRFSCPGVRLGAVVSRNRHVMAAALKFAMVRLSAPTLEQYGIIPLLENPRPYTQKITAEYRRRRDAVLSALRQIPGVICRPPQGAFYLLARLPVDNAERFVRWLLTDFTARKKTVLVTPAQDFYLAPGRGRNEVRIAFVLPPAQLKTAIALLGEALEQFRNL